MKKFLLSVAVLSSLAAPALAGRLDDADPSVRTDYTAPQADIDYGATRSIQSTVAPRDDANHTSLQRGDQGAYFGANSH